MSTAQQVANSFVTEFFERVAKNPAEISEMYGQHSSVTINDFEMGTTEAHNADVPAAVQQWASIVANSQLIVDTVTAAPLYSGVNVFVTLTANGVQQQYFQIITTLEGYTKGFGMESYFIRHQVISRIGAIPAQQEESVQEQQAEAEPVKEVAPAPVVEAPVEKAPEPQKETPKKKAKKVEVEEPKRAAAEEPEAAAAPEEAVAPAPAPAVAAAPAAPKSWASLASAAKGGLNSAAPVRVVAGHEVHKKEEAPAAPAAAAAKTAAPAAAKEPRREKRVAEPVGDRLMFNTEFAVTDDEIKTALGEVAESLLSLRNHSERGHVFMDFAAGMAAFDNIRKINPVIGASKTKIIIYRQRDRQ